MLRLNEELLHFIWQHKLLKPVPLITRSGKEVFVLKTGTLNADAGPDFFNAQIRIGDLVLAGNIEIHISTSDWIKHKHQQDKSYNNLILHAVYEHDMELEQNTGNNVEVLELNRLIDERTLELYEQLAGAKARLPCAKQIGSVNELKFFSWIERMTIERLENKVNRLEEYFGSYCGDYSQTFYTSLLRSFGFKVNALPFELLAKELPVHVLLKHADNLLQLEALLLGMSGFLEEQFKSKPLQDLQNEFEFFKKKYSLVPLKKELFKFSRLRPANFPNIRLAQIALLFYRNKEIFTAPQHKTTYIAWMQAFEIAPAGYWKSHYIPDGKESIQDIAFGRGSAELLIINTVAPFFFFYARKLSRPEYAEVGIELLKRCKAESNSKTKLFDIRKKDLGNAASSQAIIHLFDTYCVPKRCLKCGIAAAILNPEQSV